MQPYDVYGISFADVEVDLLTGQHQIQRVDLIVDAGESLSPEVDVGQIEGAYMTGLGYWLMEEMIFSEDDGAVLTNRTWNYHPPTWNDIPIDWRTELRKNSSNSKGVLRSKGKRDAYVSIMQVSLFSYLCSYRRAIVMCEYCGTVGHSRSISISKKR